MLFNSIEFLIFFIVFFWIYFFPLKTNTKKQNILIFIASYIFYGWWDYRFLLLIALSTLVDFFVGDSIYKNENKFKRKLLLILSLTVNLGLLIYFKYCNFFIDSLKELFLDFGINTNLATLNIILPVGISFYTFQTLSYTLDIYNKKIVPTKNILTFASFVSFFPQLVAGPIERATNLLPQFNNTRKFNRKNAINGIKQVLWGLFKKVVIADNCAKFADVIFNNYHDFGGFTLLLGAAFFSFQIYCDFSGYSDIAIGISRIFGFNLKRNFAFPYFSRDIAEFWRRWHISLSTWFRDYLYIPLGGSRGGLWIKVRNTFAIFLISGFWHGANWTFIIWGALNAIYFLPLLLTNKNRKNLGIVAEGKLLPSFRDLIAMFTTFGLTVLAWIFFRAENVNAAFYIIKNIFSESLFSYDVFPGLDKLTVLLLIAFFISVEWLGRHHEFAIERVNLLNSKLLNKCFYYLILILLFYFQGDQQEFIYFQF
ncbi:MAG: MBOAT family O-acyltransferase [Bacteroidota bacterium]|nr:MBOAT family O-acyltransferase [Bacteroidota bacterium]